MKRVLLLLLVAGCAPSVIDPLYRKCDKPEWLRSAYWNWGNGYRDRLVCVSDGRELGSVFSGGAMENDGPSVCLGDGSCLPSTIDEGTGMAELVTHFKDRRTIAAPDIPERLVEPYRR